MTRPVIDTDDTQAAAVTLKQTGGYAWPGAPARTLATAVRPAVERRHPHTHIDVSALPDTRSAVIEWEDGPSERSVCEAALEALDARFAADPGHRSISSAVPPHPNAVLLSRRLTPRTVAALVVAVAAADPLTPLPEDDATAWAETAVTKAAELAASLDDPAANVDVPARVVEALSRQAPSVDAGDWSAALRFTARVAVMRVRLPGHP